jgi:hypothetical protein
MLRKGKGKQLPERLYLAETARHGLAEQLMAALPLPQWWQQSGGGSTHWSQPFFPPATDVADRADDGADDGARAAAPRVASANVDCGTVSKSIVWISAGGTVARPHRDLFHNFHVVLAGTKTFHLVDPERHAEVKDVSRPCIRLQRGGEAGQFIKVPKEDARTGQQEWSAGFAGLEFSPALPKSCNTDVRGKDGSGGSSGAACGDTIVSSGSVEKGDGDGFEVLRCELEPGDVLFMPHDWYVRCQNPQHFPHPLPSWLLSIHRSCQRLLFALRLVLRIV